MNMIKKVSAVLSLMISISLFAMKEDTITFSQVEKHSPDSHEIIRFLEREAAIREKGGELLEAKAILQEFDEKIIVVKKATEVIGFASYNPDDSTRFNRFIRDGFSSKVKTAFLNSSVIAKKHKDMGYERLLLQEVFNKMKEDGVFIAYVLAKNLNVENKQLLRSLFPEKMVSKEKEKIVRYVRIV